MRVDGAGSSSQREVSQEEIFGLQEPGALMLGVVWVFLQEEKREGWLAGGTSRGICFPFRWELLEEQRAVLEGRQALLLEAL